MVNLAIFYTRAFDPVYVPETQDLQLAFPRSFFYVKLPGSSRLFNTGSYS